MRETGPATGAEVVHVVVPAHDEEALLPACLRSVSRAATHLRQGPEAPRVRVTIVLDACTDRSADVVAAHASRVVDHTVDAVAVDVRRVGVARAAGVSHAARLAAATAPGRVWVATTDADTVVPRGWLTEQVDLLRAGVDLFVGRVHPDDTELDPRVLARWWQLHDRPPEPPVHGANLGFTLATYLRAGGFPPVAAHEDVGLVRAAVAAGCSWSDEGPWTATSSRLAGRAPHGFAVYLDALARDVGAAG